MKFVGHRRVDHYCQGDFGDEDKLETVIRAINERGVTVLLVEQNAHMALRVAHRGYVLEAGRIVLTDTAANLEAAAAGEHLEWTMLYVDAERTAEAEGFPEVAKQFSLPVKQGVIVAGVEKGGPAALAGIRRGDIIISVEGSNITGSSDLRKAIRAARIGDKVNVVGLREGKQRNFVVTIREKPAGK